MRFYALGNMYLSSIQQGIQAFHCLGEMVNNYPEIPCDLTSHAIARETLHNWMQNHKTLICLNGGNNASLVELYELLTRSDNPGYPVAKFHEDEESMGGMLTCVGVVLSEDVYDPVIVGENNSGPIYKGGLTRWEADVFTQLKQRSLAR